MEDMYDWTYYGMSKVQQLAQKDAGYQELAAHWEQIVGRYEQIRDKLTDKERDILVDCECVQADMGFTRTMIAYELGRRVPRGF